VRAGASEAGGARANSEAGGGAGGGEITVRSRREGLRVAEFILQGKGQNIRYAKQAAEEGGHFFAPIDGGLFPSLMLVRRKRDSSLRSE